MADQVAENKRNAVAFYDLMFNQGKPAEAVEECREQGFFRDGHVKSNFLCNIGYSDRENCLCEIRVWNSWKHARCGDGMGRERFIGSKS
jgi:hypothetical protein